LPKRECLCWKDLPDTRWQTFGLGPASVSPTPATVSRLAKLENDLGYSFRNKWLLLQSLTHPSYGRRPWPTASTSGPKVVLEEYQRLEFLGDALLDFIVLSHLYVRNLKWDPGRLTAEKAALVGNQFLAWVATDRLSVYKYVIEFLIW